jgi:hypothetical protein
MENPAPAGGRSAAGEICRYFRVPLEDIALVRALVEAHEGIAQVVSLAADRGELELIIPEALAEEAEAMVTALSEVVRWVEIPRPADAPGPAEPPR